MMYYEIEKALAEGAKVKQKSWSDDRYIYQKDGMLYNEKGLLYFIETDSEWEIID